jgi:citronellol/citronellal dehydrogenase
MLAADPPPAADVAVVITGVNDVIDQVSSRRAVRHRAALAAWLLDRRGARHVVFASLPPIGSFPLLPQPLRRCMGADAARHDAALARWSAGRPDVSHAAIEIELTADVMAPDGFHPGEPVYRVCGEALARHIAASVWPALQREDGRPIIGAGDRSARPEAAGGRALPCVADIRDEAAVESAVRATAERFGGIDILVNNASAISLTPTAQTPMKRFDLMFGVNVRGTFLCTQACLPHLAASAARGGNPHVLNMAPPLSMKAHWFAPHTAYTMAKYGMSLCTLGHAAEFRPQGIAVNSLWPRTVIATAALQMIPGLDLGRCRKPEILADAAHLILTSDAATTSGNFFIDDELLARHGITDLDRYSVTPGTKDFIPDLFVD